MRMCMVVVVEENEGERHKGLLVPVPSGYFVEKNVPCQVLILLCELKTLVFYDLLDFTGGQG